MKGKHHVLVKNRRIQYQFDVERNITVLKGDSATGKTTLIEMIAEFGKRGMDSGVVVQCDKPCVVQDAANWKMILENTHDSIVFIDEGDDFVRSVDFANLVKKSDNYYVIATRAKLANLPYSVMEVYGIRNKSGNKYQGTKRLYSEFYPLYAAEKPVLAKPDCMIVEDSNAGYDFFSYVCKQYGITCISAGGNANVEVTVSEAKYEKILVIADGAAFGPYIERLLDMKQVKQMMIWLPESFEWLVLKSDLLNDSEVREILQNPAESIESSQFFSWEQFFTSLLQDRTENTYLAYTKKKLNPIYLQPKKIQAILKEFPVD